MNMPADHLPEQPFASELDALIREALQADVGTAEPSPLVWARIRAEVEADRVPVWVAWWRRLQLACADMLPRLISNAVVVILFLLLGGLSLRGYSFFDRAMTVAHDGPAFSDQRQIVAAERWFQTHYRVVSYEVPVDAPPKGVRRATPRPPALPSGPQHLVVEAVNPS